MKYKIIFYIFFITLFKPSYSQCTGDCKNGAGKKEDHFGKYVGFFKNSLKEGYGKFTFSNGEIYEGQWQNDRPTKGKYTWKTGEYWDGGVWLKLNYKNFSSNVVPNGNGILTLPNGDKYRLMYASKTYTPYSLGGTFDWFYPQSCYKLNANGIWIEGEFKSDEGFVSRVELRRRKTIAEAKKAEAKYRREVEEFKLAQQRVNLSNLNYLPIEVNELNINSHKIGLVTTAGTRSTGGFIDFAKFSEIIKINNSHIPGFVMKNGIRYYNLSAIKAITSQLRAEKWHLITLSKYQEYCDELNKIGENCFNCEGKKYKNGILSYNTCNACNYFTNEQRKFIPCSVCRNTRMVNVVRGRVKCWSCAGKGKHYRDYSFSKILAEQLTISYPLRIWCVNGNSSFSIAEFLENDKCDEVSYQSIENMFFPLFIEKE
jgi:hypothetical protein